MNPFRALSAINGTDGTKRRPQVRGQRPVKPDRWERVPSLHTSTCLISSFPCAFLPLKAFYLKRPRQGALPVGRIKDKILNPPPARGTLRIHSQTLSFSVAVMAGLSSNRSLVPPTPAKTSGMGWHARAKNARSPGKPRGKTRANILLALVLLFPLSDNKFIIRLDPCQPTPYGLRLPGARQGRLYITGMLCKPSRVLVLVQIQSLVFSRPP